jgi:hypothetical protein
LRHAPVVDAASKPQTVEKIKEAGLQRIGAFQPSLKLWRASLLSAPEFILTSPTYRPRRTPLSGFC